MEPERRASLRRTTGETDITLSLVLDGTGQV
ncbi:MAG: imidazoleglycerol-phosphate dehydratase, partial [Gluconacetobacter diazotrophicus]|nr:imidazoleglycerol-phosphate dehydratase [Gluconacetobacter diazotrophicus]